MSKNATPDTLGGLLAEAATLKSAIAEKLAAVTGRRAQAEKDARDLALEEAKLRKEVGRPAVLEAIALFKAADLEAQEVRGRAETAIIELLPIFERLRKAEGLSHQAYHRIGALRQEAGLGLDDVPQPNRPLRLDFSSGTLAAIGGLVRQSQRLKELLRR